MTGLFYLMLMPKPNLHLKDTSSDDTRILIIPYPTHHPVAALSPSKRLGTLCLNVIMEINCCSRLILRWWRVLNFLV